MPKSMQIWNVYRNRYISAFMQAKGAKVISSVGWGDYVSYSFAFKGIQKKSIISISSVGCTNEELFISGMKEAICQIEPTTIIFYGEKYIESSKNEFDNFIYIKPFCQKFRKIV